MYYFVKITYIYIYNKYGKYPPTLWSGVLEHLEAKGGGFLPLPPSALGALPGHPPNINPFEPNGPSLDPFELSGSYNNINCAAQGLR